MTRSRSNRGRRRNRDRANGEGEVIAPETGAVIETAPADSPPPAPSVQAEAASSQGVEGAASPRSSRRRRRPERRGEGSRASTDDRAGQRRPAAEGTERDESTGSPRRPGAERPDRRDRGQRGGPDTGERQARPQAEGGERGGRGRTSAEGGERGAGRDRNGRRRQRGRPQVQPMPTEVLKPRVQVSGLVEVVAKRELADFTATEVPVLGCPMLTRTRMGMPFARGRNIPRCALAWAIHSEEEAALCMETPDLTLCWKAHPEQVEVIRERLAERAAD